MKKSIGLYIKLSILFLLGGLGIITINIYTQNVGIGTSAPCKKLSVRETIVANHDEENNGSMDSANLLFGKNALADITINKLFGLNRGCVDV